MQISSETVRIIPKSFWHDPDDPEFVHDNWVDKMNSPNGYFGWAGNCPSQNYVDKFQMANGMNINESGSNYDPQNPYIDRELRFYANIVYNGRMYRGREAEFFNGGLDSPTSSVRPWNASPTGYTLYKFMDESVDFTTTSAPTPYIIYRLAEIYLNYAEAQYHLGNEDEARDYVNRVRTRAELPEIQSSGDQLLQDIRHERSIELAFENDHRWNDLRRWEILDQVAGDDYIKIDIEKDGSGNLTYNRITAFERNFQPRMYSLPIPLEEIQKSSLKQNPGY
ncbi:MAG: RagB/SusD family nutrient uptake outer membrane protein [Balneolaceae bacterium]|nr:RagB/SusD family nutrient uptake outer membrane protein [Balneolaceae bacterium]